MTGDRRRLGAYVIVISLVVVAWCMFDALHRQNAQITHLLQSYQGDLEVLRAKVRALQAERERMGELRRGVDILTERMEAIEAILEGRCESSQSDRAEDGSADP
jgi:hypothetical protein